MAPLAQRDDIAANLDLMGKLSVAIIPLSFAIGLATLAGECFAIGGPAWTLVGFSDAVAAATKAAPVAFVILVMATLVVLLYATRASALTDIPDQGIRLLNYISFARSWLAGLFVVASGVSWYLLPWKYALVIGTLTLLPVAIAQIAIWSTPGSRLPNWAAGLILALVCAVATTTISFALTARGLQQLPEKLETHTICWDAAEPNKCEYGLIVARFSDTTVFRGRDGGFNYIANSEIKRIREITKDAMATSDR